MMITLPLVASIGFQATHKVDLKRKGTLSPRQGKPNNVMARSLRITVPQKNFEGTYKQDRLYSLTRLRHFTIVSRALTRYTTSVVPSLGSLRST